jgi:molecular chaperone DnaJ
MREGRDIRSDFVVHLLQAVLGDEVSVNTVDGAVTLKIPAGTASGQVFRLRGHGVPAVGGGARGDHLAKVKIKIPEKFSKEEREHYEALAKIQGLNLKSKEEGFFGKLF